MKNLLQDIRFAWRTLSKSQGFALVAILTFALGIGANSTVFSWINSTLLNPLPGVKHTTGLVSLTRAGAAVPDLIFSYPDYADLRDRNHTFSGLAAFKNVRVSLTGVGRPENIWGIVASSNYFNVLDVHPILGRGFLPEEGDTPGSAPVVIISYGLWKSHFGCSKSIIGQKINVNQHSFSVVGVAPSGFQGSQTALGSDIWLPMMMENQLFSFDFLHQRDSDTMLLFGRLRPGVSLSQAQEETKLLMRQIVDQYPVEHKGESIAPTVEPIWRSSSGGNRLLYIILPILMGIAGLVLLLACANVANLLLVRSVGRRREIAIRLSLGATRWRLVRQQLVESAVLALFGGAAAILCTLLTSTSFTKFIPPSSLPVSLAIRTDGTVVMVTFGISVLAAIISGTLAAFRSSNMTVVTVLKEEAGSTSGGVHKARLAGSLVIAQLALSLVLLVCAGLFIRSFQKAQRFDPGFNPDQVLLSSYDLFIAGYNKNDAVEFNRQLVAKIQDIPGVRSAALANWVPLGLSWDMDTITPEGYVPQPQEKMTAARFVITPNYFHAMQIPLVSGHDFTTLDTEKTETLAIVNQEVATRYWPPDGAIGKRIGIGSLQARIVGIARNVNYASLNEPPQPAVYLSEFQAHAPFMTVHARVAGDPQSFAPMIEQAIHGLNPDLPVFQVRTLRAQVDFATINERIAGTFVGTFGLLALVLAAVGIYGVIAYTTRQRTREIGIRMALGAQRSQIMQLVLSQGMRLVYAGLGLGLALSVALTHFLTSLLFGITALDPLTFGSVAALLALVALASCYLPAHSATSVDPMVVLRGQ